MKKKCNSFVIISANRKCYRNLKTKQTPKWWTIHGSYYCFQWSGSHGLLRRRWRSNYLKIKSRYESKLWTFFFSFLKNKKGKKKVVDKETYIPYWKLTKKKKQGDFSHDAVGTRENISSRKWFKSPLSISNFNNFSMASCIQLRNINKIV